MLKKLHRISKTRDFQRTKARGQSFFSGNIGLRCLGSNLSYPRFGFIVSNKVSKKATVRNKVRRQLSEIIRVRIKDIKTACDCVIMVRPGVKDDDFKEIKRNTEILLKRSRILKR